MSETPQPAPCADRPGWLRRIGWLVLIWAASVLALLVVALAFRTVMGWVGLTAAGS